MTAGVQSDNGERLPILSVRNVSKKFGGVLALNGVSLVVEPNEVHGLLGENGSGKSTLIKILAGYHEPEPGASLQIAGTDIPMPLRPGQFRDLGMSFVHQDLGLVPSLSVLENLRVARFVSGGQGWYIDWAEERRRATAAFERLGVDLDLRTLVSRLRPVDRVRLAIVRAVEDIRHARGKSGVPGVLVLDEPTAFLPQVGKDALFALIREVVSTGAGAVLVSHDLDEVQEITDRVTVLRDGRVQGTVRTSEATHGDLVQLIIGRRLGLLERQGHAVPEHRTAVAAVSSLSGEVVRDISFAVHEGEVLGLAGLIGSGFDEVPYLLFGARQAASGALTLKSETHPLQDMTPRRAISAGIGLLPGDRQRDGAVGSLPLEDNVILPTLGSHFRGLKLSRRRMRSSVSGLLKDFDVRPPDPSRRLSQLSGGNQQKALIAKWLSARPSLLLLHEPTVGVDVGAREQIFATIREIAKGGTSVLCSSSDFEQLAAICDRVLIFHRGEVRGELVGDEVTKAHIEEQSLTVTAA